MIQSRTINEDTVGLMHVVTMRGVCVCYEGGLDENGKAVDTHTPRQREVLRRLVHELRLRYPEAQVIGHRNLSPTLITTELLPLGSG